MRRVEARYEHARDEMSDNNMDVDTKAKVQRCDNEPKMTDSCANGSRKKFVGGGTGEVGLVAMTQPV